jgi:hypothetical protein
MKGKDNADIREVIRKLDAILAVLLESMVEDEKKVSITKRIWLLHTSGLKPSEIARILGKTPTYVNVVLGKTTGKHR